MSPRAIWTRRVLWCVTPVHVVLGAGGLLMLYPWLFNYLATGGVALVVELIAYGLERFFGARPDPEHRWVSRILWITAALSGPLAWVHLSVSLACASVWRLSPRVARPLVALALATAMTSFSTWMWRQSFGEHGALEYLYVTLYAATTLPLVVLSLERALRWLRRSGAPGC
jgi:hypothetical protein